MVDDFLEPEKRITLEPQDIAVPYTFTVTVCSSATANDGHIPYGTNISTVTVVAYNSAGTAVTSDLINGTPSVSSNVITVYLDYPDTNGVGNYKLTFKCVLDNSKTTKELDFVRIWAENT